ncbi:DUF6877 family protein [Bacillus bombysepticus]
MNYINRITELAPQVPAVVLEDVTNRIKDWNVWSQEVRCKNEVHGGIRISPSLSCKGVGPFPIAFARHRFKKRIKQVEDAIRKAREEHDI